MSNFRGEQYIIRVSESIDGFDPNAGLVPSELSHVAWNDCHAFDHTPLCDFASSPYLGKRWYKAAKGLASVRGRIAEVELMLEKCQDAERRSAIEKDLKTLRTLEDRLDTIDLHGLKFYFYAYD